MTHDNVTYAVFPGPLCDLLFWAAASPIVAPYCEKDYRAAHILATWGMLEWDETARVFRVPNTWAREWVENARLMTRREPAKSA